MAHYIDKAAVMAEIEKLHNGEIDTYTRDILGRLKSNINSLEVKEVDIEDSIKETLAQKYINYTFRRHNIDPESKEGQLIYYAYMHGMNQCLTYLRAQKGE